MSDHARFFHCPVLKHNITETECGQKQCPDFKCPVSCPQYILGRNRTEMLFDTEGVWRTFLEDSVAKWEGENPGKSEVLTRVLAPFRNAFPVEVVQACERYVGTWSVLATAFRHDMAAEDVKHDFINAKSNIGMAFYDSFSKYRYGLITLLSKRGEFYTFKDHLSGLEAELHCLQKAKVTIKPGGTFLAPLYPISDFYRIGGGGFEMQELHVDFLLKAFVELAKRDSLSLEQFVRDEFPLAVLTACDTPRRYMVAAGAEECLAVYSYRGEGLSAIRKLVERGGAAFKLSPGIEDGFDVTSEEAPPFSRLPVVGKDRETGRYWLGGLKLGTGGLAIKSFSQECSRKAREVVETLMGSKIKFEREFIEPLVK